ncbi:MAG: ABC transporter ATP-binding protein [Armatimonadota bacterium]|nr:ABC transporter ATP-binding protein [bacterium]MCS7308751.1 ABC transporter ATP-binding protein [Armatimonadota bacterium]MDW8103505.1 ABC transporter ATP-binding protein [Armatimonadota bacterium]MDW8289297.1 ABC transporter ATP-binding protein [Armatimonadota bacterium]
MGDAPAAVRVEDVWYVVDSRRVLQGVSLEVFPGEVFAIMGPSGCGKTTLLKLIGGLLQPLRGHIWIGPTEISRLSEAELAPIRKQVGLVFQYAALFDSLTVYENVAFGVRRHITRRGREVDHIVREKLEMVGMAGTEHLYPAQLSGGMQKRVGLARALAMNPRIVLYDEPTAGLDPIMAEAIDQLIVDTTRRLRVTSLVVSHDLTSVFHIADRVAMLHEGRIVACGTPDQLRTHTDPVVRRFLRAGGIVVDEEEPQR